MMRRAKEENERLQRFISQHKQQLEELQAVQPDLSNEAQRLISEMHSLVTETARDVAPYRSLWDTYSSLPGTPR